MADKRQAATIGSDKRQAVGDAIHTNCRIQRCYLWHGRAGGSISGSLFCVRSGDLTTPHHTTPHHTTPNHTTPHHTTPHHTTPHTLYHINIYTAPHPKRSQTRSMPKTLSKRTIHRQILKKSMHFAAAWWHRCVSLPHGIATFFSLFRMYHAFWPPKITAKGGAKNFFLLNLEPKNNAKR